MSHSPNACSACGSTHTVPITTMGESYVWCINCKIEGPHLPTEAEALAAWDADNPMLVYTETFWEPWPGDGIYRLTVRSIRADEMEKYEQTTVTLDGKEHTAYVLKEPVTDANRL